MSTFKGAVNKAYQYLRFLGSFRKIQPTFAIEGLLAKRVSGVVMNEQSIASVGWKFGQTVDTNVVPEDEVWHVTNMSCSYGSTPDRDWETRFANNPSIAKVG